MHQLFVWYIEVWRSDCIVYLAHHIITIGLISSSYYGNYLYFGAAVLCEQDFADIFLPVAKMFLYVGNGSTEKRFHSCGKTMVRSSVLFVLFLHDECVFAWLISAKHEGMIHLSTDTSCVHPLFLLPVSSCPLLLTLVFLVFLSSSLLPLSQADVFFATFAVVWIPTRHVILPMIIWEIYSCNQDGRCPYKWDPSTGAYWSKGTQTFFVVFLFAFHCLLLIWLKDLLIGVYNAIVGGGVDDHRSDSEGETDPKKKKN